MSDQISTLAAIDAALVAVQAMGVVIPPPPPPPVGVRIRVTAACKVRATPVQSDPGMGSQPIGVLGTVKQGVVGGNPQNGYTFIDFDSGPTTVVAAQHGWAYPSNFVVI